MKKKKEENPLNQLSVPGPAPDARRWRFIVIGPTAAAVMGGRGAVDTTPLVRPVNSELECERGRVVEEASLGKVETPPFRVLLLLGAPDARFLNLRAWLDIGKSE